MVSPAESAYWRDGATATVGWVTPLIPAVSAGVFGHDLAGALAAGGGDAIGSVWSEQLERDMHDAALVLRTQA